MYMAKKKPSVIRPGQRLPDLFQQPDEFLQLGLGEMAQELVVQGDQRLIQGSQGRHALVRERHIDDPAILLAAQPVDEPRLLQPVDQAGDAGHNGDGAVDQPAALHHECPVEIARKCCAVEHGDQAAALELRAQIVEHVALCGAVEGGQGVVEDQEVGPLQDRPRDRELLALGTRETAARTADVEAEAGIHDRTPQVERLEHFLDERTYAFVALGLAVGHFADDQTAYELFS